MVDEGENVNKKKGKRKEEREKDRSLSHLLVDIREVEGSEVVE